MCLDSATWRELVATWSELAQITETLPHDTQQSTTELSTCRDSLKREQANSQRLTTSLSRLQRTHQQESEEAAETVTETETQSDALKGFDSSLSEASSSLEAATTPGGDWWVMPAVAVGAFLVGLLVGKLL